MNNHFILRRICSNESKIKYVDTTDFAMFYLIIFFTCTPLENIYIDVYTTNYTV